jgi:hypothetical protein
MSDFAVSQWRDTSERAMRPSLNDEKKETDANEFLIRFCRPFCPNLAGLAPHVPEKSMLKGEMVLTNFGMKKGSFHVSMEKSGLWTSRLTVSGRRTVAVVNVADAKQHLKSDGVIGKDPKVWLKEVGASGFVL